MIPIQIPIPVASDSDSDSDSSVSQNTWFRFWFRFQHHLTLIPIPIPTNQALILILIPESDSVSGIIYNSEVWQFIKRQPHMQLAGKQRCTDYSIKLRCNLRFDSINLIWVKSTPSWRPCTHKLNWRCPKFLIVSWRISLKKCYESKGIRILDGLEVWFLCKHFLQNPKFDDSFFWIMLHAYLGQVLNISIQHHHF